MHPLSGDSRRFFRAAIPVLIAALFAGAAPFPGAAVAGPAQVTLTPAQVRDYAFAELQAQHYDKALSLADTLLARNPKDAGALIIRSQALRGLGRVKEAEAAARAGFAAADSMSLHYGAALALAQALSLEGRRTWSQLWLRRANHYATTDEQRHRVASDYAYVRSQNPLKLSFTASVQPSDNVNNGSIHSTWNTYFFGIPVTAPLSGDAQALSGVTSDVGVSGNYVLAQGQTQYRALTFGASDHSVFLSPSAQAQAPTAKNSDYRYDSLSGGFLQRDLLAPNGTILTSQVTLGHSWYGSVAREVIPCPPTATSLTCYSQIYGALANDVAASFQLGFPTAPGQSNFFQLYLERNQRIDKPESSDSVYGLTAGARQAMAGGDQFEISAGFRRHLSQDPTIDHLALNLDIGYAVGHPIAGILWSGSVSLEEDAYAQSPFSVDGRHDSKITTALNAELTQASIYGFSPVVTLSLANDASNIDFYDSRNVGIGLSFRSRF